MANMPYVGDIGLKMIVTIINASNNLPRDLSQATVKKITVKKPGGASFVRDMEIISDGSDGQLQYVSIAGDLSVMGAYVCQINLALPDWSGSTSTFSFNVRATI